MLSSLEIQSVPCLTLIRLLAGSHAVVFWDSWDADQMGMIPWLGQRWENLIAKMQIDTSNLTNAFVSGMKEDLNLYGNQYNWIVVSWTIGYIIGQWVRFMAIPRCHF